MFSILKRLCPGANPADALLAAEQDEQRERRVPPPGSQRAAFICCGQQLLIAVLCRQQVGIGNFKSKLWFHTMKILPE